MLKSITITGEGLFGSRDATGRFARVAVGRGEMSRMIAETLSYIANQWHHRYYEGHFTAEGARKYRYGRRFTKDVTTGTVKRRKSGKPKAPDARPLVWSGRSLQRGRNYRVDVRVSEGRPVARVVMPVNALNIHPRHNPSLRMRDELTTVLPSEIRTLTRLASQSLEGRLGVKGIKAKVEFK